MNNIKYLLANMGIAISLLGLAGCAGSQQDQNIYNESIQQSARLWIPVDGLMNWGPVFNNKNISFTASYQIQADGSLADLSLSNIFPNAAPDKQALEQLAQSRFAPTQENHDRTPVKVIIRIEQSGYHVPVLQKKQKSQP